MGSGPFVPTNLAKDVSMELERNPNYWKEGLPYLDGIIHYYIADKGTAIGSYRTGQVLMTHSRLPTSAIPRFFSCRKLRPTFSTFT